jgi:hypothetical protein
MATGEPEPSPVIWRILTSRGADAFERTVARGDQDQPLARSLLAPLSAVSSCGTRRRSGSTRPLHQRPGGPRSSVPPVRTGLIHHPNSSAVPASPRAMHHLRKRHLRSTSSPLKHQAAMQPRVWHRRALRQRERALLV